MPVDLRTIYHLVTGTKIHIKTIRLPLLETAAEMFEK